MKNILLLAIASFLGIAYAVAAIDNSAEEVAWVIGDQPIWKSEIEEAYQQMLYEKTPINGDPYCVIPEQLAIEKLYLHQAELDTIEASESMIMQQVEQYINNYIAQLGSQEKVEQMFNKPMPAIRETLHDMISTRSRVQQVQRSLVENVKATPSDVRRYFNRLSEDSIPYVPRTVEVQILTAAPAVPREEIENVKARLRDYSDRVTRGESDFSTLAILYSEDPASAARGGELGFAGRATFVPEFTAVAFNLNDPKKVSKIVETEYGYHIIQLIEKRGDRVNVRHILLRPRVSEKDLTEAVVRLDSLRSDLETNKIPFEEAVAVLSQDKDTRNNRGVMVNSNMQSDNYNTSRFEMADLPQEIARQVDTMQPGDISQAFIMKDPKTNQDIVALVKLTNRIEGHRANLSDDYQLIKNMCEQQQQNDILNKWLEKKIAETYTRIEDGWRNCEFKHKGWIKTATR
ncbi:MAG: peptidylprolyl isomerase [Duncaniella sp.]|nr:peptidylprolyl isomerase [Duncaniella sp.]